MRMLESLSRWRKKIENVLLAWRLGVFKLGVFCVLFSLQSETGSYASQSFEDWVFALA